MQLVSCNSVYHYHDTAGTIPTWHDVCKISNFWSRPIVFRATFSLTTLCLIKVYFGLILAKAQRYMNRKHLACYINWGESPWMVKWDIISGTFTALQSKNGSAVWVEDCWHLCNLFQTFTVMVFIASWVIKSKCSAWTQFSDIRWIHKAAFSLNL